MVCEPHTKSFKQLVSVSSSNPSSRSSLPWLFSPAVDLFAFLGSALVALLLLAVGWTQGWLESDTPEWMWIVAILMIDVAHVYATGFRVYFDRNELRKRPWLYGLTPLLAFIIGLAVYSESSVGFWRVLAYLAVFHFIRQQYGWVALYRSRGQETDRFGWWVDASAIYLATIYPLIHWHCHLPRRFYWFLKGDFTNLPAIVEQVAAPVYWLALTAYFVRAAYRGFVKREFNPGKDVVVMTTAVCWYVGIIAFNSDYAFTVTNVIIHGIPYMVLIYWYGAKEVDVTPTTHLRRITAFLGIVWVLAYLEELLWDVGLWHERGWLFGRAWDLGQLELLLVPLLAVPQLTHYILDGFIWRRNSNQEFSELVS